MLFARDAAVQGHKNNELRAGHMQVQWGGENMQNSKEKTLLHCATANTMRQAIAHQTLHKEVPQWLDSRGCSPGVVAEASKTSKATCMYSGVYHIKYSLYDPPETSSCAPLEP